MTKTVLLAASLISALIATGLAFEIIHWDEVTLANRNRLVLGWASWSLALYVAASIPWSRFDR